MKSKTVKVMKPFVFLPVGIVIFSAAASAPMKPESAFKAHETQGKGNAVFDII